MHRFERIHARIFPRPPVYLFLLLTFLVTACSVPWLNLLVPPVPTAVPGHATVTPRTVTPTEGAPTGTPGATSPIQTATATPAQTVALTPTDPASTGTPALTGTPTPTPTFTRPASLVLYGSGNSNAEKAHLSLQAQAGPGNPTYLIIVSPQSADVEGAIYRDLRQRFFRTTTGPDEGIDTSGEFCHPRCVFVLGDQANAISVNAYMRVLQHEYRHVVQATNNPNMARDFREANGVFTPYGAFSEACADYGLNVALVYRAAERIGRLKSVMGADGQALIDRACAGYESAYQDLVNQYNQKLGNTNAFGQLFPPYR